MSWRPRLARQRLQNFLANAVVILVIAVELGPILWIILSSFKEHVDIFNVSKLIVFSPTLRNYRYIFETTDFPRVFWNSLSVTALTTMASLFLGFLAAYGLARFDFKGRTVVSYFILATRLMPAFAILIPTYLIFSTLGLQNTRVGLVVAYTSFSLPFAIWVMRGFIRRIPVEIEESAKIDGCSTFQIIFRIAVPLSLPGISAAGILLAISAWGEFIWALVLTSDKTARTLPVLISGFQAAMGLEWGPMTAAASIVLLPVAILALLGQRFLISGITAGGLK